MTTTTDDPRDGTTVTEDADDLEVITTIDVPLDGDDIVVEEPLARSGSEDPRIRERRVAVIREQGRRRLRVLGVIVGVLTLLGLVWLVVHSPLLAVQKVTVTGTSQLAPQTVLDAAGVKQDSPLMLLDTGAVARRVGALSWASSVKVTRHYPHEVRIEVVERVPEAWVRKIPADAAGAPDPPPSAIVDASGRVLADAPAPPVGVPELVGVRVVPAPGARIRPRATAMVLASLPPELRPYVTAVVLKGDEATLRLGNGPDGVRAAAGEVRLGAPRDVPAKGQAALAVLRALGTSRVGYVDVRVPSAPATG